MTVLAISGSLRSASSNTAVLEAMRALAPEGMTIVLYRALGELPHFNPDHDGDRLPDIVCELRSLVGRTDAILISSPEYAHGVPGSLKNLLDWLVGSVEFPGKPVALINMAARAVHADAALKEILTTMSAKLIPGACVTVSLHGRPLTAATIISNPELASRLTAALGEIARTTPGSG
jgi:chromate reductase, NAD(P)H dehydrogenase (quinone)